MTIGIVVALGVVLWMLLRKPKQRPVQVLADSANRIGSDKVGPYWISTVDLGIEIHGGRYETMVFRDGEGWQDKWLRRYRTRGQARVGHRDIVEEIRLIEGALS